MTKIAKTRVNAGKSVTPPRLRCPLHTLDHVKVELARLYREAKAGRRDVSDASKLANLLSILARMIEGADIEARIDALEANNREGTST